MPWRGVEKIFNGTELQFFLQQTAILLGAALW